MDDRELEARLRARLHRRFDGAEPPATLRPVLSDVAGSSVRLVPRSLPIAWLAVATLIIAIAAGLGLRAWSGPGGPASPTLEPTTSPAASGRQYIVLPPAGSIPSKASTSIAIDTLNLRLRSIGLGTFSSAAGDAITFQLPPDVDDALIRRVLSATGELSFVPLPPEDYGAGEHVAVIGEPLPVDEPELFGLEQIGSAGVASHEGVPFKVHFRLRPIGAAALEVYSGGHIGETFAILVDGKVALLPVVQASITGGILDVTGPDPGELALLAAIVTSGSLPEGWREPRVPVVIPEAEARDLAVAAVEGSATRTGRAELTTYGSGASEAGITAAWAVVVHGSFPSVSCGGARPSPATQAPCPVADTELVILDAVTGAFLEGQAPAP